jgi:hypothetical protein
MRSPNHVQRHQEKRKIERSLVGISLAACLSRIVIIVADERGFAGETGDGYVNMV